MMDWRPFDIKSFLKASKHWKNERERLETELKNILYLPSVTNESGVRSGNIAEPAAKTAIKTIELESKIDEIKHYEEMLDFALGKLTTDERALIDGFFYPKKTIGVFVHDYGRKHGLCKDYVYAERERILRKLRRIIENEYYK